MGVANIEGCGHTWVRQAPPTGGSWYQCLVSVGRVPWVAGYTGMTGISDPVILV